MKLTATEKRDLAYHKRCRAVCQKLGLKLLGSSIDGGFSTTGETCSGNGSDITHGLMVKLEKLLKSREENETRDSLIWTSKGDWGIY